MASGNPLSARTALAAVRLERYGLSLAYLVLGSYHAYSLWSGGPGRAVGDGALLVGIARQVIQLQLELYVGVLLLLGRRATVLPRTLKDVVIPLAGTFFNLTYNVVAWLPPGLKTSLCPVGWQGLCAALGLVLNLIGLSVAIWSAVYLGRSFGILVEVKQVVTDGAYRWVRHPMYAGYTCLLAGLALANFSIPYFVLVPIHVFLLVYRGRLEERRLCECSSEYRDYCRRTGFIFPAIRLPGFSGK